MTTVRAQDFLRSGVSARVGVLGGGQLGRMLALAGIPLGIRFRFLDPDPDSPAKDAGELIVAPYTDEDALRRFAQDLDAITYEFENVPASVAAYLASHCPVVFPPARALKVCQDRLLEKQLFQKVGLGTPRFAPVSSAAELREAVASAIGTPCVLKTRRMGYDGKGQTVIRDLAQAEEAFARVGGSAPSPSLIVESFVPFLRELSLICVRGAPGSPEPRTRFYPLVENHHAGGVLRRSIAPATGVPASLQSRAERLAQRLLDEMDYVGVLTIELFETEDKDEGGLATLLGNEMAPRVHNSGHWTIEGSATSQFENHLRAVLGWPTGSTLMREGLPHAAMLNLLRAPLPHPADGGEPPVWMHTHLYAKGHRDPAQERKVGHVTIVSPSASALGARLDHARKSLGLND